VAAVRPHKQMPEDPAREAAATNAVDQLRAAADLVEKALMKIDGSTAPCTGCGGNVARRPKEYRSYRNLLELPERLRKNAAELDAGGGKERINPAFTEALEVFHAAGKKAQANDDEQ
jgi:hypothetical protein